MLQLAEEFFEVKNDPEQLSIDENVLKLLHDIHPATTGEKSTEEGPVAWTIVIPTTYEVMNKFLRGELNERELFEHTLNDAAFEAVYLCSALVLPEYRGKGFAKELACNSIKAIRNDHPIKQLYYWEFSGEGTKLAEAVAKEVGLPLLKRV